MSKLQLHEVGKHFALRDGSRVDAVSGVSFEVERNEICTLLGPSGCGKSTVLRMIAGLETPSEGRLVLDGHEIDRPDRERGMVFQAYTSFDWLTVRENVEYGMRVNGMARPERRERAQHFIDLVRLDSFADAYPSQLSGGMKQRVAIARTLANEPSLLLMDEPFGALDAETRWQMQELLLEITARAKTTILMVTHDVEEAIFLSDRIFFMSRHPGQIHEVITPSFKAEQTITDKEALIALPGYSELERRIMRLMREQGSTL